jgi:hypothetical protein
MHRATADEIIRQFREFGAAYFTLDEYRAICG